MSFKEAPVGSGRGIMESLRYCLSPRWVNSGLTKPIVTKWHAETSTTG